MKKSILILTLFFAFKGILFSQISWQSTNLGTNEFEKSVKFINPNTGWIAVESNTSNPQNPRLLKTNKELSRKHNGFE